MGLVFRELTNVNPVIVNRETEQLTSTSVKFLRSLGLKIVQNVRHRQRR